MQPISLIQLLVMTVLVGCIAAAVAYFPSQSSIHEVGVRDRPRCSEFVYGATRKSVHKLLAECLAKKAGASKPSDAEYRLGKSRHYKFGEVWDLSIPVVSRVCYGKDLHWYFDLSSLELVDKREVEWMC